MARTCIICGGSAGSREHIFPATLGGRRTNKGIYCGCHNNAYSGLASIISEQLLIFNAQLGVVGDHADEAAAVTMTDIASGHEIELTNSRMRFKRPRTISEEVMNGKKNVRMAFSSQKEFDNWAREQKAKGIDVQFVSKGQKERYYVGPAKKEVKFGGTREGLRAIGYIAQTFLAHSFPHIARLPELQAVKDYTLKDVGSEFVWWDFASPDSLPANRFRFGHRVVVGVNKDDGTAYASMSFFSTLNFAIRLGSVPVEASRAVITDIDPLAKSPPHDIITWTVDSAAGAVSRPDDLSAGLAEAISTGRAQAQISELMQRISDFERETAAAKIMRRIGGASSLPDAECDALFAKIVSGEAQRVFNLMTWIANDLKQRAANPVERAMAAFMEKVTAPDPEAENGLSAETTRLLWRVCDALAKQMSEECKAGTLNQDRMSILIGGGPGAYAVGNELMKEFAALFRDR